MIKQSAKINMPDVLQLLLIFFSILHVCSSAPANESEKVKLSEVKVLRFFPNLIAQRRRSASVHQMNCVAPQVKESDGCTEVFPTSFTCLNNGTNGTSVRWKCKADSIRRRSDQSRDRDDKIININTIVTCEGYDGPTDPYVLISSCSLDYEIVFTDPKYPLWYIILMYLPLIIGLLVGLGFGIWYCWKCMRRRRGQVGANMGVGVWRQRGQNGAFLPQQNPGQIYNQAPTYHQNPQAVAYGQNIQPIYNNQNNQAMHQNLQPTINNQNVQPMINNQNAQPMINNQNAQPMINSQNNQAVTNSRNSQPLTNAQNIQPVTNTQNAV